MEKHIHLDMIVSRKIWTNNNSNYDELAVLVKPYSLLSFFFPSPLITLDQHIKSHDTIKAENSLQNTDNLKNL